MVRLEAVTSLPGERWFWARHIAAAAAYGVVQPPGWVLLVVVLALLAHGLLAELVRRNTLIALLDKAPVGTVLHLGSGPGGPALSLALPNPPRERSSGD